ncbi:MAG: GlxA family transcriptional regulator [Parvibaculaceae bacterium]
MTRKVAIVLLPEFTHSTLAAALEVLSAANRVLGRTYYEWSLHSPFSETTEASNGLKTSTCPSLAGIRSNQTAIVCSGLRPTRHTSTQLLAKLRFLHSHGAHLGGLCTGSYALAAAGLLNHRPCTVHWGFIPSFREMFPLVEVTDNLFELEGDVFSSAGLGTVDLMLEIVATDHSGEVADFVAEKLCHVRRLRISRQRRSLGCRVGSRNELVLRAIRIMESNLENELSTRQIARQLGVSVRQMERLFSNHVGEPPKAYFRRQRFSRAHRLLTETNLSVSEVAAACGLNYEHFARLYRKMTGVAPSEGRQMSQRNEGQTGLTMN